MSIAQTSREPASTGGEHPSPSRNVEEFLHTAVKRFARVEEREATLRQEALDDLKFKNGDQWPEQIKATRTIEKRPCLTINKMKTFVHQITNDQRQNRPSINVSPVGDKGDPETARMLRGLIRQIERQSRADIAYDTGFDSAVSMGWGYWRILTEYEDDASFNQVIRVERISNPFTVYLDCDSTSPDGSDAQWAFITKMIPRKEFEALYKGKATIGFQEGTTGDEWKLWNTETEVRIAEYFYIEHTNRTLLMLANGHIGFEDKLAPELKQQMLIDPSFVIKKREVREPKVKWCKITAHQILEEQDWLGKHIPIIRVIGDEVDIEGRINYAGIIRDGKDPQRMYNFWVTSETEMVALAPKAPWIMEEGMVEGHEAMWKQANNKSLPYLLYKGTSIAGKPAPPPQRQQFDGPPAAIVAAKLAAAQDMQAVTGIRFDATLQERMYDESGKALRELKRVSDIGNFHYVDNLARSLRYTGVQLIDLIPKVYDTPRILTILREDDSEEKVEIDPNLTEPFERRDEPDGGVRRLFNPKLGEYEVAVTIGPNFATKRAEAADSMMLFLKAVPNAAPVVADLIAKNMDWPGAEEISERLQTQLPPSMLNKKLQDLPPEARGMVQSLLTQMEQLKAEHDKAVAMVADKEADRQIERDKLEVERQRIMVEKDSEITKIREDYATKMANVQMNYETKMAAVLKDDGTDGEAAIEQAREKMGMDYMVQMAKIQADFEAKMAKVIADAEAKATQVAQQAATATEKIDSDAKAREEDTKVKQAETAKFDGLKKSMEQLEKRLGERIEKMENMEIVFDRDPKTNRMKGARFAPKGGGSIH